MTMRLRAELIQAKILPDGHVVLHSDKASWAFTLTPLGALVWEFSDGTNTVEQIVEKVSEAGAIPIDGDLRSHVNNLVAELEEYGLLLVD
jgi:hypothetical protein